MGSEQTGLRSGDNNEFSLWGRWEGKGSKIGFAVLPKDESHQEEGSLGSWAALLWPRLIQPRAGRLGRGFRAARCHILLCPASSQAAFAQSLKVPSA